MRASTPGRLFLGAAVTLLAALALTGSAAASADQRSIVIRDDCDPATFNAAIGPGTCVGEGDTTFPDFIAQIVANGNAPKWRFSRDDFGLDAGGSLSITNEGGEFHTFTEVAKFGGGCIQLLDDLLGLTPVPECQPEAAPGVPLAFVTTGVEPGSTRRVDGLRPGMHLFQCLIHPWMRSTAVVRAD